RSRTAAAPDARRLERPCRTRASSALDAALRELGRIEQGREPLRRKGGIFGGDVADRAAFFVRALRDRRALLVADDRIQRGHENRVPLERRAEPLRVDRETFDRGVREHARRAREKLDALYQ